MGQSVVIPEWVGYAVCAYAGVAFGSNFVPVKRYDAGDGVFFQWVLCSAIFIVGFIVNAIRDFPDFQPLAMLGGFLWATGNMMAVPIIQCIGLSLGLLLWGLSNLLMGWSTGTFGWFGLHHQTVPIPALNYVGAGLAVVSGVLFAFIRPNKDEEIEVPFTKEDSTINEFPQSQRQIFSLATMTPNQKRAIGIGLSVLSGLLYGSNFTPPQYIMDNCTNKCSQNGLDYVFFSFLWYIYYQYCIFINLLCTQRKQT